MIDSARSQALRRYSAPNQNYDTSRLITWADQERREKFYLALNDYLSLVVMTGKAEKAAHLVKFLQRVVNFDVAGGVATQAPHLPELSSPDVNRVAQAKAAQIFGQKGHVDSEHPATQELVARLENLITLHRFMNTEGFDLIRQALPTGTIALAADVNFHQKDGETGTWKQDHKLGRSDTELGEQEKLALVAEMKQFYCFPKSREVHVIWDNSVAMLNGQTFYFRDRIEVISAPLDPELFDIYLKEAMENGLFYSANTHFGLLECLIANQKIKTVAVLSDEEIARGLTFKQKRMKPVPSDFPVLLAAIKGNRPPRLIQ